MQIVLSGPDSRRHYYRQIATPAGAWIRLFPLAVLLLMPHVTSAALFHKAEASSSGRGSNITLRKRIHVNTLIAEPGTGEVDFSGLYSFSTTNLLTPFALRFTPEGRHLIWGRTEYAVSFDLIDDQGSNGSRDTRFGQSATLTATTVLHDGDRFDFAIAPQATVFLRDETGARLGAVAIGRYDVGKSSIGGNASWSGATHPSAANPAGVLDLGCGMGRRLAAGGVLGRFTPHVNALWERASGVSWDASFFEGVEYQATERLGIDISGQHLSLRGTPEHQIVVGVTYSLGHTH